MTESLQEAKLADSFIPCEEGLQKRLTLTKVSKYRA